MSLQWHLSRDIPADTAAIGCTILRSSNPYRQIGDRFNEFFPDESVFQTMYDTTGRGAIPPLLLGLITVFQMWEKVSDRLAAEWVVTRLDWKYALHLPATYAGFHFTDLSAFRARLIAHQQERLFFDQLIAHLKTLGLIAPRGKVRTDSSHIIAMVERLGCMELVTESIRVTLKAMVAVAPTWCAQMIPPSVQEAYRQRQSEYGLSESEIGRRLSKAGQDGFWLLAQWDRGVPVPPAAVPLAVETLRTVLKQQFCTGDPAARPPKRPCGRDVIDSPHEPEARSRTKRSQTWSGYKMQVSETCDDNTPHLLVDVDATGAYDNDSPELPKIQARLVAHDIAPEEQYVDQAYVSGQNLVTSRDNGITLMGKPLEDTSGPTGFRQTDFVIDEAAHQATCPAGQQNTYWHEDPAPAEGLPPVDIRFDGASCQQCVFFGQCTASPRGRSMALHPYRRQLAERRREAQTEGFHQRMHRRAGVEGTISELVRAYRLRHARYRGRIKVRLQTLFTAVAANLKRVVRWWVESRPQRALPGVA